MSLGAVVAGSAVPEAGDILLSSSLVVAGAVVLSGIGVVAVEAGGVIEPGVAGAVDTGADVSGVGADGVCAVACDAAKSAALANRKSRIFDVWE